MSKINGTELTIEVDTVAIALNTSVSMSVNSAEIECTNKDSAGWKEILVGTKDWSMTGSSYVDPEQAQGLAEAWAKWEAGDPVAVVFTRDTPLSGDQVISGSAYFTNIEQTGEVDGAAEYTFTLSGTGALTTVITAP